MLLFFCVQCVLDGLRWGARRGAWGGGGWGGEAIECLLLGWQLLSVCDHECLSVGCHPFGGASSVVDPSSYVVVAVVYVLEIVIIW